MHAAIIHNARAHLDTLHCGFDSQLPAQPGSQKLRNEVKVARIAGHRVWGRQAALADAPCL